MGPEKKVVQSKTKSHRLRSTIITAIIAGILLVVANIALWANNYMFNSQNFASIATASLTSESSREAIAQGITDEALKDRPTIKSLVENTSVKVIAGVLNTDRTQNLINRAATKLNTVLTSNKRESVVINLEGVKDFLTKIIDVIGQNREVKINPQNIPSQIVLLDKNSIPSFYKLGVVFLWLGPLALIGAIAALAYPYLKRRTYTWQIIVVQGIAVAGIGLLSLLIGPLVRPMVLSNVNNSDFRTVVSNLYNDFLQRLDSQTYILVGLGILTILVGLGITLAPKLLKKD